jgi:hypothetical protein
MEREQMMEILTDSEALTADGLDDCIIGIGERCSQSPICVYDRDKVIEKLTNRDGMTVEEAEEFFEYNIVGAWVGEGTPMFLTKLEE